jgi:hypothetical protein
MLIELLLFIAPALLLAFLLYRGHYVGEELVVRLASRRARPARRSAAVPAPVDPPTPQGWLPRGAALIAFSIAKRPPPLRLLPQN